MNAVPGWGCIQGNPPPGGWDPGRLTDRRMGEPLFEQSRPQFVSSESQKLCRGERMRTAGWRRKQKTMKYEDRLSNFKVIMKTLWKVDEMCSHLYSLFLSEWSLRAQPSAMTSRRLQTRLPIRAAVITFRGTAARQSLSSLPSKQSSWPSHRHVSKMHKLVPQWKFPGWQS